MDKIMADIPGSEHYVKVKPLIKGMSNDKKYYIETAEGKHLLLRIAEFSEYEQKKIEYEVIKKAAALDIPVPQPMGFGICDGGNHVYTLLTWIDGEEVEKVLPTLLDTEQYALGKKSGEILKIIHKLPAPKYLQDWETRYFFVMDERIEAFKAEGIPFDGDTAILSFLEKHRHLLKNRPQCRHHSDYHEGNMILSKDGKLHIIDWHTVDFENYGDPWYEFNRVNCNFPAFATGQIKGYFDGSPPDEFWILLAYYQAVSAITSIVWAKYFAPERLNEILLLSKDILRWYDNFQNIMPTWFIDSTKIEKELYINDPCGAQPFGNRSK